MTTTPLEHGQLCRRIALVHVDGTRAYPVTIKNQRTGRIAFNLAKGGTASHHREAAIEVDDESEVVRRVLEHRMKVRCQAADGSHRAQYSPDGRNIAFVETGS